MKNLLLSLSFIVLLPVITLSQSFNSLLGDESILYAQTKQVNQFFRRFNGEEDTRGNRYYKDDLQYRNAELRRKYLNVLFDYNNSSITDPMRKAFITDVLNSKQPVILDFHQGQWFAEVATRFKYKGQEKDLTLFLKLEPETGGYKWVFTNVYFKAYHEMFSNDTVTGSHFLHPLSHELDFMNLIRVFKDKNYVELYTEKSYRPDFLTLFLYEFKKGDLQYVTVKNVKFHFFQVPGWYFELSNFNRPGTNSGWLISSLLQLKEDQKEMVLKYIYHE
ncbi:MAG: hypothetical protein PHW35_09240 [Lentimicrobiaceae bacterium]|jgi:hypothetical protein|nr:hypothetical protein [Lentimicrobiaceae bacterium]MDY0025217.1 hypothetical protein [Lentimicrobium sp.]HAH59363.1 hypothetical protein [Bacteroidales bacterium]